MIKHEMGKATELAVGAVQPQTEDSNTVINTNNNQSMNTKALQTPSYEGMQSVETDAKYTELNNQPLEETGADSNAYQEAEASPKTEATQAPEEAPTMDTAPEPTEGEDIASQDTDEGEEPTPEGKEKRSLWKRIIGTLTVIVLVLGGFTLYVKHRYDKSVFADTYFTPYKALAVLRYDYIGELNKDFYLVYQGQYKGLLNQQGKVLIPAEYKRIDLRLLEAGSYAYTLDGNQQKQGYINWLKGITEPKYDEIFPEINGLIIVGKNGLYGILNYRGEEVIPLRYKSLAYPEMSELKNAWYNEDKHEWHIGCTCHREVVKYVSDDLILAQFENGKYGYLDEKGEVKIPAQYDEALPFESERAAVKIHGKWGYIYTGGSFYIEPKYQEAWSFDGDFAVVRGEKGLGFVDDDGDEVSPLIYDDVKPMRSKGLAPVSKGDKWGLYNRFKDAPVAFIYDDMTEFLPCGLAGVCKGDKWGVINEQGVLIIPIEYDSPPEYDMEYGIPRVSLFDGDYNNYFDISGNDWDDDRYPRHGC